MHCHKPHEVSGIGMTSQRTRDRMVGRLVEAGITDLRVLEVMAREPRHLFLDEALSHRAYEDTALPIGHGQTLSQPWMVARMSELVLATEPASVLEIGTGSGYQTLILARLVERVWSLERIRVLQTRARARLHRLAAHNVRLRLTDGAHGWPEAAPFDVILLTACASELPAALLAQLGEAGVLIAPIEDGEGNQWLTRVQRHGDGYEHQRLEQVRFVPLLEGVIR
ncbi:MAG: protein-L-isoaspartate(D-aspartate) O-methyltransferase [Halomonas sp.]|nr:protein-L-isoaspartate(D-aspartate) O-methyltransferase [Halomonas sp.]